MTTMVRCDCGNAWVPEGMCCLACEPFMDEDPLPSDEDSGYTAEDQRLEAMEQEARDYGDVFGTQQEKAA